MVVAWILAVSVSVVPIFWNNWGMADSCDMHKVRMDLIISRYAERVFLSIKIDCDNFRSFRKNIQRIFWRLCFR